MPSCPTCSRESDTDHGMRVHHSMVHDEQLPNATCRSCGTVYYSPDQAAHRPDCVDSVDWRVIPGSPWRGRTILDGGTIDGHCDFCATPLKRWPGDIKGDRGYCNRQCQTGGFSEAYIAEGHPNWAGGGNRNYGKGWRRAKLDTLERDGYRCVRCGTSDEEMGRNPDVHGIIPVRLFDESPNHEITDAHFPANLASLCVTHHRRADHGRFRPRVPWDAIGANVSLVDDRVPDAAVDYVTRYDFLAAN